MGTARRELFGLALALLSCGDEIAPPRAQYLVSIDTNAPIVGQLSEAPWLSPDAAIDTLSIDVLDDDNQPIDSQTLARPDASDWPVSFGIASGARLRLRVQAYRALFTENAGAVAVALPEMAIDRAIVLDAVDGVVEVSILLDADCRGRAPSFLGEPTTCVDADRTSVAASEGIALGAAAGPSAAGSWQPASEAQCQSSPRPETVCIPGGFSALGESRIVDLTDVPERMLPLRPVILSPFFIDVNEFSVKRYRELVLQGRVTSAPPVTKEPDPSHVYSHCTWLGEHATDNDAFALNCVTLQAASEACALSGGRLPTEAEWEHAARGRGQRRLLPWGSSIECCHASVGRGTETSLYQDCPGQGMEPLGAHPPSPSCGDEGDVSRDGVIDLAGGVHEFVSDRFAAYDQDCWQAAPLLVNPRCEGAAELTSTMRGGNWSGSLSAARSPLRARGGIFSPTIGFRCAYDDAP